MQRQYRTCQNTKRYLRYNKKIKLLEHEDTLSINLAENKSLSKIDKKEIEAINNSTAEMKALVYITKKKLQREKYKETIASKTEEIK